MNEPGELEPAASRATPADEPSISSADVRMADLLAGEDRLGAGVRRRLQDEGTAESDDLLARLNALDYLDTLVGEVGGDLPERLGDYRIVGLLGRGGMGTVFEAFQESLERVVALKVLSPTLTGDPRMRKRFRTEARANATLHHQHIVPVYGFGEAAGYLYFAMERVDGVSLDKHLAAVRRRDGGGCGVMLPRECARRFAGVADALGHAHRRGILHRDVKPGNVLVHPDGALALADFGLSKVVGDPSMSLSQAGGFLGTLHYAAPEQARGQPVTPASDLYSLGVTMFECLTGQLPVRGETTEALLQSLLHEVPRPLRHHLPRAPRDFELVLEKLLAKDPEDRYADGEALARDLVRIADDEPVQVRRRSVFVRAWRTVRKHRLLSAMIAVASALLLVVFVLWRQFVDEERVARTSRHENQLAQAVAAAETEPGRLDGPDGLLETLLGADLPDGTLDTEVFGLLDAATVSQPDNPRAAALRTAYVDDPVPEATEALRAGRGAVARALLDARIAEAEARTGFAERDAVTWLALYRLYTARAIASLTATVGDAEAAGNDLLRASFVRPGAFAPALLSAVLEWRVDTGVAALAQRIQDVVARAPDGAGAVAAALLRTIAGIDRPRDANLMDLGFDYDVRRELLQRAEQIARAPAGGTQGTLRRGAIELALEGRAREAAAALAELSALRDALTAGYALLDAEVAPTSALQSWRAVFALLESADLVTVAVPGGQPLPLALRVRGIEDLLGLGLPADVVRQRRPQIEQVLGIASASGVAVHRAEALLAAVIGDGDRLLDASTRWVDAGADDPEAYLLRLQARILRGETDEAAFDGTLAVQRAANPESWRTRVADAFGRAAMVDPARASRWADLQRNFTPRN